MVKDAQVGVLRRKRMEGKRQEASAGAAGMSVRSARKWEHGLYPSQRRKPHTWRTREDPFAELFDTEVAALLVEDRNGVLEATTILAELNRRHPGRFGAGQLRTLQRRVRQWRGLNGPEKEVFFPQEHPPGREAAYDFTNCTELGITICGAPFDHLLFELVLLQRLALADGGAKREFRGAPAGRAGSALATGRRGRGIAFRQSVGGDP